MPQSVFTQPWEQPSWQPQHAFVYGDNGQLYDVSAFRQQYGRDPSTDELGDPTVHLFDMGTTDPQTIGDYRRFLEESTGQSLPWRPAVNHDDTFWGSFLNALPITATGALLGLGAGSALGTSAGTGVAATEAATQGGGLAATLATNPSTYWTAFQGAQGLVGGVTQGNAGASLGGTLGSLGGTVLGAATGLPGLATLGRLGGSEAGSQFDDTTPAIQGVGGFFNPSTQAGGEVRPVSLQGHTMGLFDDFDNPDVQWVYPDQGGTQLPTEGYDYPAARPEIQWNTNTGQTGTGTNGLSVNIPGIGNVPLGLLSAGLGGIGSIVGGVIQGNAAQHAAQVQAGAAQQGTQLLQQIYGQQQANQAPYLNMGYAALAQLGQYPNYAPPPVYGAGPPAAGVQSQLVGGVGAGGIYDQGHPGGNMATDTPAKPPPGVAFAGVGGGPPDQGFVGQPPPGQGAQSAVGGGSDPTAFTYRPPQPLDPSQYAYTAPTPVSAQQYQYTPTPALDPGQYQYTATPALDPNGYKFQPPSGQQVLQQDPGYQFRLSEGMKALDRSAAARGNLLSGAQLKAGQQYAQGEASQEYQNAYARARDVNELNYGRAYQQNADTQQRGAYQDQTNYTRALQGNSDTFQRGYLGDSTNYQRAVQENSDTYARGLTGNQLQYERSYAQNQDLANRGFQANQVNYGRGYQQNADIYNRDLAGYGLNLNRLQSLAGIGQTSVGQLGQLGSTFGQGLYGGITSQGAATAGGIVGQGNAINGGISGVGNSINGYLNYSLLSQLLGRNSAGSIA